MKVKPEFLINEAAVGISHVMFKYIFLIQKRLHFKMYCSGIHLAKMTLFFPDIFKLQTASKF
jgi:hypothetical protein